MTIRVRNPGLKQDIRRWQALTRKNHELRDSTARFATGVSKAIIKDRPDRRPQVASRPDRPSGMLEEAVRWIPTRTGVRFDINRASIATALPGGGNYWMIQEVGSGQSAEMVEVLPNGAFRVQTVVVSSQLGRRIHPGLVFVAGGTASPPQRDYDQPGQIVPASQAPTGLELSDDDNPVSRGGTIFHGGALIRREIQGKGFVRRAGIVAATRYRRELLQLVEEARRLQ